MFLPILVVATVAATLTIGGLLVVQSHSRSVQMRTDGAMARFNAASGIEMARAMIANDSAWRSNRSNGAWITDLAVGPAGTDLGRVSVSVTNPFGALNRLSTDSVIITATGTKGTASHTIMVDIQPSANVPLTCLDGGISSVGTFSSKGVTISATNTGTLLTTNADCTMVSGANTINVAVEASGTASGSGFKSTTTNGVAARTFPDATVFDKYSTATAISTSSLPTTNSAPAVRNCLLSPANNPFGTATNPRGIYLIDCGGAALTIQSCRIVGTLVVKNCSALTLGVGVVWEPAEAALPCLLVQGPITFASSAAILNEATLMPQGGSTAGVNLNPATTPYPFLTGTSDTDISDTYSPQITGLVYCSGNVTYTGATPLTIHSLISGGTISIGAGSATISLKRDTTYITTPPPGFYTPGSTSVIAGTYR